MEKDLIKIYKRLKKILKKYENPLKPKMDLDSKSRRDEFSYDLWSIKDVEIAGRKRKEVFFAGLIIQSKYVGFYYMPVYVDTSLTEVFKPELLKLLKGKSCFHIKSLDEKLEKQIAAALKKGYSLYKKRGWV